MSTEMYAVQNNARKIVETCDALMAARSRINDRESFARLVIQNLFGEGSLDLLLMRPKFDELHAEALNRLSGLIGFESSVFRTIYTNEELFVDFIRVLCDHAIRSNATAADADESIYTWLLMEYLEHLLPIDEAKLAFMKNSNWFCAPLSSNSSTVSSPRKLLRPEVLAASYPLEHISIRSSSIRSLYPRLIQFVGNLVKHFSSLQKWPSIAQLGVLKVVLTHYHDFLLTENEDPDFGLLKATLIQKPLFISPLQNFLERLLANWPLNVTYVRLIELWLTLTYPPQHRTRITDDKLKIFMQGSTQYFVALFEMIIMRVLDSDSITLLNSPVLDFLEQFVFAEVQMVKIFDSYGLSVIEFLELTLNKLTRFQTEQRLQAGAKVHANESLFAKFVRLLFSFLEVPAVSPELVERHIRVISQLLQRYSDGTEFDASTSLPGSQESQRQLCSRLSAFSTRADEKNGSLLNPSVPDHQADPWTKMLYLTPQGRLQILNREARFDFKQYSKQIAQTFPAVHQWEIAGLARWLHLLSLRWTNCRLVRYLREHSRNSYVARNVAKLVLNAPSPPRYVPVFSKYVPQHSYRLNLRPLASIPVLFGIIVCMYLIVLLLWKLVL
ncbi:hypothetical protein Ddc_10724 [Ditylenchus destructor]|nr:hypothetical protein Ddc_10724 [Ditylenchus destructor]